MHKRLRSKADYVHRLYTRVAYGYPCKNSIHRRIISALTIDVLFQKRLYADSVKEIRARR